MWLAKHGKGMLSSVEQAFVGRDEKRAPLKTPAWEASSNLKRDRVRHLLVQTACVTNIFKTLGYLD